MEAVSRLKTYLFLYEEVINAAGEKGLIQAMLSEKCEEEGSLS